MSPNLNIDWVTEVDLTRVSSPAVLLSAEAIRSNIDQMISMGGDPNRLRPHVKTHKLGWIVKEQMDRGIVRFKCATIAEAEMCAEAGAVHVLLAMQPVGPAVKRFIALQQEYTTTQFACLVDNDRSTESLSSAAEQAGITIEVLLDLDVGQHRSGVAPGDAAERLYNQITVSPGLRAGGLHAYDGHLHQSDILLRTEACEAAYTAVEALRHSLVKNGKSVPCVVVGGTPTFPIHAKRERIECSPGTCVLWDAGYATKLPDLNFRIAAVLLTRVISKPTKNRLCLDLGHKAVASEMPHPRVIFLKLPNATVVAHNEEHLVLETDQADEFEVGDPLIGIPWHICPTMALHAEVIVCEAGRIVATHPILARARKLTV